MGFIWRMTITGLVLVGHFGFFLYWFNRINATGLNRIKIKKIEKSIIAGSFLLPMIVVAIDFRRLAEWFCDSGSATSSTSAVVGLPIASMLFGVYATASFGFLAPGWLWGRPIVQLAKRSVATIESSKKDVRRLLGEQVFAKSWVHRIGNLPGNQLHIVETNVHELTMARLPSALEGLSIGHISDLHLTGYMHREFYQAALSRLVEEPPDIVVLSGDIIDFDHCLPQVQPLLEPLNAQLGRFYVLGNHDRRIRQVDRLRAMLAEIGWHDLGTRSAVVERNREEIFLIGNERPWFDLSERREDEMRRREERTLAGLRIGVSHSPDQYRWGSELGLDLLFCGHTHGGQVRFPIIGPIIAPSWYGSRYASGWFAKSSMLMHVSRGLSGTHPFRFNCTPEVTICKLKAGVS